MRDDGEASRMRSRSRRNGPSCYEPRGLDIPTGPRLRSALVHEHGRAPFGPRDVREAAHRVVEVARRYGCDAQVVRGGLDVGGAELDHVWAVVEGAVIDVTLPLWSDRFAVTLRAYIAGDVEDDVLDRDVHGYTLQWRVLGEYPASYRYVGAPVWSGRAGGRSR